MKANTNNVFHGKTKATAKANMQHICQRTAKNPVDFVLLKVRNNSIKFIPSEGGTRENQSPVTPLKFWIVLIFLAEILLFSKYFIK